MPRGRETPRSRTLGDRSDDDSETVTLDDLIAFLRRHIVALLTSAPVAGVLEWRLCFVWTNGDAFDVEIVDQQCVPARRINEIVLRKRRVSADTALRLGRYFDTTPQFWLGLRTEFDVDVVSDQLGDRLDREVRTPTGRP